MLLHISQDLGQSPTRDNYSVQNVCLSIGLQLSGPVCCKLMLMATSKTFGVLPFSFIFPITANLAGAQVAIL